MFKVLVVDDDENVCLFISRLLYRKFRCQVVSANNGLEALSKIKEESPEVILLDVTMPVMNGIETLEAIRNDHKYRDLHIIMLTAVRDRFVVDKVMNLGVLDYMLKPLMYDTAYERFKELFDRIKKINTERERACKLGEEDEETSGHTAEKREKVLIVDTDSQFRAKLRKQLEATHSVYESDSGAEGLTIYIREKPSIVCLGEDLPLLNEKLFAQKIRARKDGEKISIFAIRDNMTLTEEENKLYNMVISRKKGLGNIVDESKDNGKAKE